MSSFDQFISEMSVKEHARTEAIEQAWNAALDEVWERFWPELNPRERRRLNSVLNEVDTRQTQ